MIISHRWNNIWSKWIHRDCHISSLRIDIHHIRLSLNIWFVVGNTTFAAKIYFDHRNNFTQFGCQQLNTCIERAWQAMFGNIQCNMRDWKCQGFFFFYGTCPPMFICQCSVLLLLCAAYLQPIFNKRWAFWCKSQYRSRVGIPLSTT